MSLHRALLCSIAAAGLLVGSVGCATLCPSQPNVIPASKSSSNMNNTLWNVSGEESPQTPPPEGSTAAQPG